MRESKKRKYAGIVNDLCNNLRWQDALTRNLKIQDDQMCFINTPDFKRALPIQSFIGLNDILNHQIFVYSDYNLKPGKYCVFIYDCFDHTLWYKTVIVGFRVRQIVNPNIVAQKTCPFEFRDELNYYQFPKKFPKAKYFTDFQLDYE